MVSRVSRRPEEQRTSFTQSIPRRFFSLASRHSTSGLHTSAEHKLDKQSEKRPPIPRNGILKLSLRIRKCHKDVDKSMQPTSAPQVFLFGQKKHPSLLQGLFSMQMRGWGLKNGVPYLQMGLPTLDTRVCRRPEDK